MLASLGNRPTSVLDLFYSNLVRSTGWETPWTHWLREDAVFRWLGWIDIGPISFPLHPERNGLKRDRGSSGGVSVVGRRDERRGVLAKSWTFFFFCIWPRGSMNATCTWSFISSCSQEMESRLGFGLRDALDWGQGGKVVIVVSYCVINSIEVCLWWDSAVPCNSDQRTQWTQDKGNSLPIAKLSVKILRREMVVEIPNVILTLADSWLWNFWIGAHQHWGVHHIHNAEQKLAQNAEAIWLL